MKTSYYLIAAAGLTAAAVVAYDRLPLRAQSSELPMAPLKAPTTPVVPPAPLPVLPAVPDLPLPPIVAPPDAALVIPAAGKPAQAPPIPVPPVTVPAAPAPMSPIVVAPVLLPIPPVEPVLPPAIAQPPSTVTLPNSPMPPGATATPEPPLTKNVPATQPIPTILLSNPPPNFAPAPAPIVPTAPQEPKPLPLPAPTPFTPGLDSLKPEPAVKLAQAGMFVLVKGNKVVEGKAKVVEGNVLVSQGALERSFPKTEVLYIGNSRDDVYRFMLGRVPPTDADARFAVAKWCSLSGLREQSLTEAREILKLKPDHRGAIELARSTEESLRLFPADGSAPPRTGGALVTVEEPEPNVTPEGAATFISRAQPVLANQCMECHARQKHGSNFKLIRVTGFEVGPQATHANLRAVAAQLKNDDPAESPLLVKSLLAHGGMKQPAFVSRKSAGYRQLGAWVAIAIQSVPPMTPPVQPLIAPTPPVSPIPPAVDHAAPTTPPAAPTSSKPVLPPVQPAGGFPEPKPLVVPPVLPTPSSIPAATPTPRANPKPFPNIPAIPLPPAPGGSQFGTGTMPPGPASSTTGRDEFDPAGFNNSIPK